MRFFTLFLLLISAFLPSQEQPLLNNFVLKNKMAEIFSAHVRYKELSPVLIERILNNFLEELDPTKTYFLESEITLWAHPSESTKQELLKDLKEGDYKVFHLIFDKMLAAIKKHRQLMQEISGLSLPQDPKLEDINDLPWAKSRNELIDRLLKIKALQVKAAGKLSDEPKELFLKRIEKYRRIREEDLIQPQGEEHNRLILSYILKSFCQALDAHTNYFTPQEARQFMIQVQEKLIGIGAMLRDALDGFEIMRILDNSPAQKSQKIKLKDKIIAINGRPVIGMDLPDVVELIRGQANTKVVLTILRLKENSKETEKLNVTIVREEIILDESRVESSFEPFGDGVIAYIHLFSFYQDQKHSSAQDVKKALAKIQKEHKIKGVLLDLRGNAGGLLPQAVAVSGIFINKGIVASIKDNTGRIQHLRSLENTPFYDGPLVVLINRTSASAAEIVAQSLQDYGRALVIGDERSFGKGSFQTFTLDPSAPNGQINPEGEYKVTRGLYYTVSGKSPQLKGVPADLVIPGLLNDQKVGEESVKYPLENDSIPAHFDDDLSDIMPPYRKKIEQLYKHNLQKRITAYTSLLEPLKENSKERLLKNKTYQNALKEIKNKNFDAPVLEVFAGGDLQLTEAYNVLKDLVYFLELSQCRAAGD
ncbi:MAG: S41 family peptidase [Parachlamydiales bacterium]|jgi:carboxyl-terminal processing protease